MSNKQKFIGESFLLDFNGYVRKFRVADIQFDEGLGPIFLMVSPLGNRFWLTRRELQERAVNN